jgi:hypothetical protein
LDSLNADGTFQSAADDAVTRVWAPDGAWKMLIHDQLKKRRIDFEPL